MHHTGVCFSAILLSTGSYCIHMDDLERNKHLPYYIKNQLFFDGMAIDISSHSQM